MKETFCMKCQSPFSGKNMKNISKYQLLKFLPHIHSKHLSSYHTATIFIPNILKNLSEKVIIFLN